MGASRTSSSFTAYDVTRVSSFLGDSFGLYILITQTPSRLLCFFVFLFVYFCKSVLRVQLFYYFGSYMLSGGYFGNVACVCVRVLVMLALYIMDTVNNI